MEGVLDSAFLVKKEALDKEMMWHAFYELVRPYYQVSEQYISDVRKHNPSIWNNLFWIYPIMNKLEMEKSGRSALVRSALLRTA